MRDSPDRKYSPEWLQTTRPQPMYDETIEKFYKEFYTDYTSQNLDQTFKDEFIKWLKGHEMNSFRGIEAFPRLDIIQGCTQFIDDLYQRCGGRLKTIQGDYKYHWRLNNNIEYFDTNNVGNYKGCELLISMPFPAFGDVHPKMYSILDECYNNDIPVHIDGAWIGCSRDIEFNFSHPAIHTFAISLSKGGLPNNRIGIRFARNTPEGAITIMNNFNMNQQSLMSVGIAFLRQFEPEYFWRKYESKYFKVCKDFNLTPTKSIHIALQGEQPVGIRPLLRAK